MSAPEMWLIPGRPIVGWLRVCYESWKRAREPLYLRLILECLKTVSDCESLNVDHYTKSQCFLVFGRAFLSDTGTDILIRML